MLNENAWGSPAEPACLPVLGVLAQRGEAIPTIPAPMVFLLRMHRSFRQQAHKPRAQQQPAVGCIGSTSRRTRPEPGCHDIS
jgi:hypothetical protein